MLADSAHVEVLRRGPRSWNDWLRKNGTTVPNLIRSLSAAKRQMGVMNGAPVNLASVRLRSASLRFATLSGADLTDARLDGANLTNADLSHALHNRTRLAGAKLAGARLGGTSLALGCLHLAASASRTPAVLERPGRSRTGLDRRPGALCSERDDARPWRHHVLASRGLPRCTGGLEGQVDAAAARFSTWRALRTMSCSIYCFDNLVVVRYEKIATPAPRRHRPRI